MAMRPIWKGHITFGLVNIPVTLFSAETRQELHFRMIDRRNRARVRYERVNEVTGEDVPWDAIVKGYEFEKDAYVLLSDDELQRASPELTQTIQIEQFVSRDAIAPQYFDKPYFLVPTKHGQKGYVLLRQALDELKRVGIAKVVIRARQYLAALLPQDNSLLIDVMRYAQELRRHEDFELPEKGLKAHHVTSKELQMAKQLVEAMSGAWNPEMYKDEYHDALMRYIHQKIEAGELEQSPTPEEPREEPAEPTINMMELLRKSLDRSAPTKPRKKAKRSGRGSRKQAG